MRCFCQVIQAAKKCHWFLDSAIFNIKFLAIIYFVNIAALDGFLKLFKLGMVVALACSGFEFNVENSIFSFKFRQEISCKREVFSMIFSC